MDSVSVGVLVVLFLGVGGFLVAQRRAARRRQALLAEKLALLHQGRVGRSAWSPSTAFFEYRDRLVGIYFDDDRDGPCTGALVLLGEDLPRCGDLRVRREPRSMGLGDLAERRSTGGVRTGDAGFDAGFRLGGSPEDKGILFRWMDPAGRRAIREVSRLQGDSEEPVAEVRAGQATLHTWARGHQEGEDLEALLEAALRLARPLAASPSPEAAGQDPQGFEV